MAALEGQDLPGMYLAHHEPERVYSVVEQYYTHFLAHVRVTSEVNLPCKSLKL